MSYKEVIAQSFSHKGFIAENFVQCELKSIGISPTYSWQKNQSEIEFLLTDKEGEVFPVEVKSGSRTKAKSLASYITQYAPKTSIKLIGSGGDLDTTKQHKVWPLYYAAYLGPK